MYLGTIAYYTDFIIYPVLVLLGAPAILFWAGPGQRLDCLLAVLAGILLWTFLEYAIHRGILHRIALFSAMHDLHHDAPVAKVGTPSWITLAILGLGIFTPSCLGLGVLLGSGVTIGVMIGFLWYICVHHAVHNWHVRHRGYLYYIKRYHARHHYSGRHGNYGVTTPLWDYVMRSVLPDKPARPSPLLSPNRVI